MNNILATYKDSLTDIPEFKIVDSFDVYKVSGMHNGRICIKCMGELVSETFWIKQLEGISKGDIIRLRGYGVIEVME